MTPEGKVKKYVRDRLRAAGAFVLPLNMQGIGAVGVPDDLVLINGQAVFVEYKAHMDKRVLISALRSLPTQPQLTMMDRIRGHGGLTCVIDDTTYKDFAEAVVSLPEYPWLEDILKALRPFIWMVTAETMEKLREEARAHRRGA